MKVVAPSAICVLLAVGALVGPPAFGQMSSPRGGAPGGESYRPATSVFPEAEEFAALRDVTRRLYDESINFWQQQIFKEAQTQEASESSRLDAMQEESRSLVSRYDSLEDENPRFRVASSSPERELVVLSAALDALRLSERSASQGGGWKAAAVKLEAFESDLIRPELRADIRIFASILLAAAWLNEDKPERASALLVAVIGSSRALERGTERGARPGVLSPNDALARLLLGDAAFSEYDYRESYENYVLALDLASRLGSRELMSLSELRLYWASYRSGEFEKALDHLSVICSRDSYHWSGGTPAEQRLYAEALRLSGDILFRIEDGATIEKFLSSKIAGSCRSHATAHWIQKLAENGRFAQAVAVFRQHHEMASQSPHFVGAALATVAAAKRIRPGFNEDTPGEIVLLAAPILERDGEFHSRFGQDANIERDRRKFVQNEILPAADAFYDSARVSREAARYRAAIRLYDVRIREADPFKAKPLAIFRMGQSLADLDMRSPAKEALEGALQWGLDGETEQAARESLCELASRDALEETGQPQTLRWLESCEKLLHARPTLRSLMLLHPAAEAYERFDSMRVHESLIGALTTVGALTGELAGLREDVARTFASSTAAALAGVASREAFARVEALLRGVAPERTLRVIEQANHTHHVNELEERRQGGELLAAKRDLEDWIARNPDNIYFPMALAELLEEFYLLRDWRSLRDKSLELLALVQNRPGFVADGAQAGAQYSLDRVKLLAALALEGTLRFDRAFELFAELEREGRGQSALEAREILADRYAGSLDPESRVALWRRTLSSGVTGDGRLRKTVRESGLVDALQRQDEALLVEWLRLSEDDPNPTDSSQSTYSLVFLRMLARLSLSAESPLAIGGEGVGGPKKLSLSETRRMREGVSAFVRLLIAKQRDIRAEGLTEFLAGLPIRTVSPLALLPILENLQATSAAFRSTVRENFRELAMRCLKDTAKWMAPQGFSDDAEQRGASALIEGLTGIYQGEFVASDFIALIGPNHPVFSDVTEEMISRLVAEEVNSYESP